MAHVELTYSQIAFIKQNCLDSIAFLDYAMKRAETGTDAIPYLTERKTKFQQLYDDLCDAQRSTAQAEERRPENCRFRLQYEGKPYPKSGCEACGATLMTLGRSCRKV